MDDQLLTNLSIIRYLNCQRKTMQCFLSYFVRLNSPSLWLQIKVQTWFPIHTKMYSNRHATIKKITELQRYFKINEWVIPLLLDMYTIFYYFSTVTTSQSRYINKFCFFFLTRYLRASENSSRAQPFYCQSLWLITKAFMVEAMPKKLSVQTAFHSILVI